MTRHNNTLPLCWASHFICCHAVSLWWLS